MGTPNRAMYWNGAGSPVIGRLMDATGKNVAVLDNIYEAIDPSVTRNVSYRIRATDIDGKISYSYIKTVGANSSNTSVELTTYPNPAANIFNIKFNNKETGLQTYSIYTQDGRKVQSASQSVDKALQSLLSG